MYNQIVILSQRRLSLMPLPPLSFFFNFRSLCLLIYIVEIIILITTSIVSNKRIFILEYLNEICTVLSIV